MAAILPGTGLEAVPGKATVVEFGDGATEATFIFDAATGAFVPKANSS